MDVAATHISHLVFKSLAIVNQLGKYGYEIKLLTEGLCRVGGGIHNSSFNIGTDQFSMLFEQSTMILSRLWVW